MPIFILALTGCSDRYLHYKQDIAKMRVGQMSEDEFRKKFYHLYDTRSRYDTSDTCTPVNFKGCYIFKDNIGRYGIYKFLPNGIILPGLRMYNYPDNTTISIGNDDYYYYKIVGNRIEIEYLIITRDRTVVNVMMIGEIRNDSILLHHSQVIKPYVRKPEKMNRLCIYDSTLTIRP